MIESSPALPSTSAALRGLPSVRVARKGALALGIKLIGAGLTLAVQLCLARTLGHAGYGQYAYVFAWLQLAVVFAQGGFSTAALRYVAEYWACDQPALMRGFITRSSQIVLILSVILALIMAGGAMALRHSGAEGQVRNFLIAGATLPMLAQFMLRSAVVRGLGHVISSMVVGLSQPLFLLGAVLTIAHLFRIHISSSESLLLNLIAAVGALGIVFALQRHAERDLGETSNDEFLTRKWLGTATQMMFASSLIFLQGRTGVIMTGLLLDTGQAGAYAAVERLAHAALLGLASVNMLAAPTFARLHAQQRRRELQRYARLAALGSSSVMLATAVPLILFGKPILRYFGDDFVAGYPALLVLLGGVAVNAMCGSVGFLLDMTGHHRLNLLMALIGVSVNVTLSIILVPRYGIVGTAMANAASIALWKVSVLWIVRRRLGISPWFGHVK